MTLHHGPTVGQHNGLTCIYCTQCKFRHLDPIPDVSTLYQNEYHSVIKPSMKSDEDADAVWHDTIHDDWLSLVKPLIPNMSQYPSLMDVGTGTGRFMDSASRNGFYSFGIEPNPAIARTRYNVYWGDYQTHIDEGYSVVSAHFVMEHFPDPVHFLSWANNSLADKGILLVTIPNDFSSLQESAALYLARPAYWLHHTHINYWPALEFPSFLSRHGFKTLHAYGSWEPELYLMQGLNYLDDHTLGRSLHTRRMEADLIYSRSYRMAKYLLLGQEGRGRDCTFVAQKQ